MALSNTYIKNYGILWFNIKLNINFINVGYSSNKLHAIQMALKAKYQQHNSEK